MSDKAFSDKSADEEAFILTKTIFNIMCNFIPKEIVTIHDRDSLCINNKIKSFIKNESEYFDNCVKPNNPDSRRHFEEIQDTLRKKIQISKQKDYFR